jgi:hypothetical protein
VKNGEWCVIKWSEVKWWSWVKCAHFHLFRVM